MNYKQKLRFTKLLFIVVLLSSISYQGKSQYFETPQKKSSFSDKLFFGGGLGLSFGQVTQIEVSPLVGYKLTKRFHPGIGFSYSYYNDKRYSVPLEFSTYSGSIFARYFLFESVFAHVEAEFLNTKLFTFINTTSGSYLYSTRREWIESYLVGGGYYQKIGERSGMYILLLWNLNETELTPYANPVVRIGFNF